MSQLNRESSREGRKPRLTDLKGSGGIEENASLAMFLSRDLDSKEAILSILKARSGRSGWSIPILRGLHSLNNTTFKSNLDHGRKR